MRCELELEENSLIQWFPNWGGGPLCGGAELPQGVVGTRGEIKSETKLNEYELCREK